MLFFFSSCGAPKPHSTTAQNYDQGKLKVFFEHLMIRERGLYTLLGSKPMTEFDVDIGISNNVKDAREQWRKTPFLYQTTQDAHQVITDIEVEVTFEEHLDYWKTNSHLNHKQYWEYWSQIQADLMGKNFLMVVRGKPTDDQRLGLFINVANTVFLLKKFKTQFEQETGVSFDPTTILTEIENLDSFFWDKVFHNHYLFGLVLGFGEKNSYLYHWADKNLKPDQLQTICPNLLNIEVVDDLFFQKNLKISDLQLPLFGVYSIYDETLEQYRCERERIKQHFHGQDFVQLVLEHLKRDH